MLSQLRLLTAVAAAVLLSLSAHAQTQSVPREVTVQGTLADSAGNPAIGERAWSVAWFDAAVDGNQLGTTATGTVTLEPTGRFSFPVTVSLPVIQAQNVYYELAIDCATPPDGVIDDEDIFPDRVPVTSVLFSQRTWRSDWAAYTLNADKLDGKDSMLFATDTELADGLAGKSDTTHGHQLSKLSGTVTDAQVPDNITIDYAATAGDADTLDGMQGAGYATDSELADGLATKSGVDHTHDFDEMVGTFGNDQIPADLSIEGGAIENTVIGATNPSTGTFTNLAADTVQADTVRSEWGVFGTQTVRIRDDITIAPGGKLGVSTNSPEEAVDIVGVVKLADSTDAPPDPGDRLYNNGGNLFWNGAQLDAPQADNIMVEGENVSLLTNDAGYATTVAMTTALAAKADAADVYTTSEIDTALSTKSDTTHDHNLQDLSGAVTDAQVPDTITVDHAAAADRATSATHADHATSASLALDALRLGDLAAADWATDDELTTGLATKSNTGHGHNLQDLSGAVTDAQVPDTVTVDQATNALQLGGLAANGWATDDELTTGLATKSATSHTHLLQNLTGTQIMLDDLATTPGSLENTLYQVDDRLFFQGQELTSERFDLRVSTGSLSSGDYILSADVIAQSSLGVGVDCVAGENFGFDTIRLKENNLRIHFWDTSNSSSFPSNDWRIKINDSTNGGRNYFGIEDSTAETMPFWIGAGAPNGSVAVRQGTGSLGVRTVVPEGILEVRGPQSTSSGPSQTTRDQTIAATGPYLYQTFTVTEDSFLKTVTLYVEAISGSSLHAALLPGNDPSTTTVVSTAVIEDLGAVPGSQTFDFSLVDPPAELTAGESYGLRFLGATELGGAGNVYAGGMAYDSRISTTTLAWEPVALPDNDLYFSTVLTAKDSIMPALHVADDGNVGIHTYNPAAEIDVNGAVRLQDTTSVPTTATERLYNNGGDLYWGAARIDGWREAIRMRFSMSDSAGLVFAPWPPSMQPSAAPADVMDSGNIAPYGGRVVAVHLITDSNAGDTEIAFYRNSTASAVETQTITGVSALTTYDADFSAATFSAGDMLHFSIDPTNPVDDVHLVVVLEYDPS